MFAHIGPETLLVALALLLALSCPQLGARWFGSIEDALARIARKRTLSVVLCGLSALVLRLALLPWLPIPQPYINDEFSFLLAADTFGHGHFANPTPAMWVHLETFHVIFHPTYASMYPPLSGIFLAFGQTVFKHPFWGVWLSVGLMCSAFCWMLQAWLPPSWALLGGMLPVVRFGVLSYWDNSYWGGALAATGGALVLGAIPRIIRRQHAGNAILLAIGIAMLANTRPYEGLVLTTTASIAVAAWIAKKRPKTSLLLRRTLLPLIVVLGISGISTSYYYWKVTGNALRMPQQVNRDTYAVVPYFYWQKAHPEPQYHHAAFRDFYAGANLEREQYERAHTPRGILVQLLTKVCLTWVFYVSPILTLPLFALRRVVGSRRIRFLLIAGAAGLFASSLVLFFNIHYVSPIAAVFVAVLVQGMRYLRQWTWEHRPVGLFLVRALVVMSLLMIPWQTHILATPLATGRWGDLGAQRAAIEKKLSALPEDQLVLVRYAANHDALLDWVYNGADPDHAKVIWARDMGYAQNLELLQYYEKRRVWLLEPDQIPIRFSSYPNEPSEPLAARIQKPANSANEAQQ